MRRSALPFVLALLFAFPGVAEARKLPRRWKLGAEVGPAFTDYKEIYEFQPGLLIPRMEERSIYGKATLTWFLIPDVIDLMVDGLMTLYVIDVKYTAEKMLTYGLNARIGYVLRSDSETWRTVIFGGFYHANTKVAGNAYGYRNLYGPQLYPQIEYAPYVSDRQLSFGIFAKYSPITNGISGYTLKNNEIAGGITFRIPVGQLIYPINSYTNLLTFNFLWSRLHYESATNYRNTIITHQTMAAGLGLSF